MVLRRRRPERMHLDVKFEIMQPTGGQGSVVLADRKQPPVRFQICSRCGYQQHTAGSACPAVNKTCNYCHKRGHFSRVCRAAMRNRQKWLGRTSRTVANGVDLANTTSKLKVSKNIPIKLPVERGNYVKFKVEKAWVNGLIDTGSVSTLINLALARRLGFRWKEPESGEVPILFSANGSQLLTNAVIEVTLNFLGLRLPCSLRIVENLTH